MGKICASNWLNQQKTAVGSVLVVLRYSKYAATGQRLGPLFSALCRSQGRHGRLRVRFRSRDERMIRMHGLRAVWVGLLTVSCAGFIGTAQARGASPYLPLNLSPEIERQIERVLILAGKPVMSRPIAAATVLDALPAACERDRALCKRVEGYLRTYMRSYAI